MTENKYKAQEEYEKRKNIAPKAYKLNRDLTEAFSRACKKAGRSQASVLTEMMENFIEANTEKK